MNATEFDERFDAGEDISFHVDWTNDRRPNRKAKQVDPEKPWKEPDPGLIPEID